MVKNLGFYRVVSGTKDIARMTYWYYIGIDQSKGLYCSVRGGWHASAYGLA